MSLVAYAASSDDESDNDDHQKSPKIKSIDSDGYINDGDPAPVKEASQMKTSLVLPVPKLEKEPDSILPFFRSLPAPKITNETKTQLIEEEDDEFLHKKAIPLESPTPLVASMKKTLVRIVIPALKDFDDVEKKRKTTDLAAKPSTFSSLKSILPPPKSERSFVKESSTKTLDSKISPKNTILVPDSVKNRRPAQNTENIDRKVSKRPPEKQNLKASLVSVSDSDSSDNECGDFFSLKSDENLPEVSADEIAAMVSKKAAEMAKISSKFDSVVEVCQTEQDSQEELQAANTAASSQQQLDNEAIQALIGSQAKRRKMDNLEIIDISSDQVLPNKDEWMRTALASATTYQPTGVLNDEEPASGTRRKHQITYLAHKAKANEAELQAMWSANRQNRRQTQSKYGF